MLNEYNYERLASLLTRINAAIVTLERYVLVKRIDEVKRQYNVTKSTLRRKIFSTFREIGQVPLMILNSDFPEDYGWRRQ